MNLNPTVPQYNYITTTEPYPALVSGYGGGKTEAAVMRSIIGKLQYPTLNRGFYEPTYDLIRMIAFPRFEEMLETMGLAYRIYKSPLNYLDIIGYGKIFFRSMDAPHRIVGYEHADADIDELDTLKTDDAAHVFRMIVARNRQLKPGGKPNTIGVTTTPEGFKFTYQTWKKNPKKGYVIIQAKTSSNPHLPDDYVDSLKAIYPAQQLAAYLDGQFVNLVSGTVFNAYDRIRCRSTETIQPKEPLNIGMDFNVQKMSAVVYVTRGKQWHAVAELTDIYDTPAMIHAIKGLYPDHVINIYPDASGRSRKSVDASISDIGLLEQAGFSVRANKSNPLIKDRVIATNQGFSLGWLFVNDVQCDELAKSLEQLPYDKNGVPDKSTGLDHITDACSYPVAYENPINKPILITGIGSAR